MAHEEKYTFNIKYLLGISMVSALGGLLFGYDLVVIGGAKAFYELTFGLTSPEIKGWAVSSCIVGCIIGAMGVGKPADLYGRKRLLILSAVLFFISAVGTGYAPTFTAFVLFRLLGGIGMGIASTLSPMYIAEVSPASLRGRFVALNQMTIVIGILLAQLVNYIILESHPIPQALSDDRTIVSIINDAITVQKKKAEEEKSSAVLTIQTQGLLSEEQAERVASGKFLASLPLSIADPLAINKELQKEKAQVALLHIDGLVQYYDEQLNKTWNGQTGWRIMFVAEALPAFLFFFFMFFVPNSPRWLCRMGRGEKAKGIMATVGGSEYAQTNLESINQTLSSECNKNEFAELFKPKMRKIMIIGIILAIFQQWCGINVVFNYAHDIFKAAGYGVSGVMFNLVIVGATNFLFTIVAMLTIDKLGRRLLILWGSVGLAIAYTLVGFCYYQHLQGVVVLLLVLLAIACFSTTLGPVMWVLISEIFPNRVRGLATSIAVLSLWVANFVLNYTFPIIKDAFNIEVLFWIYAAVCVFGAIFIKYCIPETMGKTLEEIEHELVG
ncbi:MAG: sugar porter family MFS transporter [Phycisphaerae bacterium]|nr:sugar porter family MFS transporter [Phycisphaerae bacterium]